MSEFEVLHVERIPAHGFLLIPGRINFEQLLQLEDQLLGRRVTYLIEENDFHTPDLRAHMERSGRGAMFSFEDQNPAAAGVLLREYLEEGGVLLFVPSLASARPASPLHISSKHLQMLMSLRLPVLPVALDCPRESCLSIENSADLPSTVLAFGKEIRAEDVSMPAFQECLQEAFQEAYRARAILNQSLAAALLQGLKKHSDSRCIDGTDDAVLAYAKILPVALAFSKYLRKQTQKKRVAIILPPGKGGLIANLAVLFAGKIPVNLNFTASREAILSSIRQADVDRFITADAFMKKVASFPWPPSQDLIFVERTLPGLKKSIVLWALLSRFLAAKTLVRLLGLEKQKAENEAILLFTSGSSGEPKGVPLSHRNVLANVLQFSSRLNIGNGASLLGCLPLFHSFGCTVTLWYPLIEGLDLVTYPSPLETKRLAELIHSHRISVLLATPTFLRGYMKRIEPEQLSSLRLIVTGAEKLPQNLADAFEQKFGIRPLEGYGLTETSPATNVNLPTPEACEKGVAISASKNGSVGTFLPGMAVRIKDSSSGEPLALDQSGIIYLKGPNVFQGYLNDIQRTREVLDEEGWFRTGDIGFVDAEGFLHIQGRLSRFSKIAGEMVPHETIEAAINQVLGLDAETERKIAIVGVPDEAKGEAIVLLSIISGEALEQECINLRYKLLEYGLTALWCPKMILPVAEIPLLASGKLDIKGCQILAGHNS